MTAKILTVDDSASIRLTTRVTLSNAGYTVTEAVDGMDGLNKLKATESDGEIKQQAKAAGATGWLTKPFDPESLVKIARTVLGR